MKIFSLPIPIYLNQQVVFDLLAVIDDGFSQISNIRTSSVESEKNKYGMGASIGVNNVFALLGVSFSGERDKEKGAQEQEEISREKIHTPTSLFAKLCNSLQDKNLIVTIENDAAFDQVKSGNFVEFKAILRKNPLADTIEGFKSLVEMLSAFTNQSLTPTSGAKHKGNQPSKSELAPLLKQLDSLLSALTSSNTVELIGELLEAKTKVVLPSRLDYFSQGNTSEIIDGEFRILGKVTRVVPENSEETINLLRKTAFGRLKPQLFDQLSAALANMEEAGLRSPELITEIQGPALLVIPIAIFT